MAETLTVHQKVAPGRRASRSFVACLAGLIVQNLVGQTLPLPERPSDALSGTAFVQRISQLQPADREQEIAAQILSGNIPSFLRRLCPVQVTQAHADKTNIGTFFTTPDYLAIGSEEDYFLVPMAPSTAQKVADNLNCLLPTPKMVDAIHSQAKLKLIPRPIEPSQAMTTVPIFAKHNDMVRAQRNDALNTIPLGALVAGHKKDVVICSKLEQMQSKVAIYGWHRVDGKPIQPLYLGHTAAWIDYSHGVRLVQQEMLLNNQRTTVSKVLKDDHGLLSDEGVIKSPRYPTTADLGNKANDVAIQKLRLPALSDFTPSTEFAERLLFFTNDSGVRIHINTPSLESFQGRKLLLLLYALPNGNTIEQTVGKIMNPGDDWHFNIQHIGAQVRFVRQALPEYAVVIAYFENDLKSWPTWRRNHGDKAIFELVEAVKVLFNDRNLETVLTGHSGGGSFIFGYINSVETIPKEIKRITFLDSNYAYDRALGHNEKLKHWLLASNDTHLCVFAYHDSVALLNGKTFVSAAGGTWGRSHAMKADLSEDFTFTMGANADLKTFTALEGRLLFILKENPEKKIYHTVQVEKNGLIHSLLYHTSRENQGYEYFGERAYQRWVQSD